MDCRQDLPPQNLGNKSSKGCPHHRRQIQEHHLRREDNRACALPHQRQWSAGSQGPTCASAGGSSMAASAASNKGGRREDWTVECGVARATWSDRSKQGEPTRAGGEAGGLKRPSPKKRTRRQSIHSTLHQKLRAMRPSAKRTTPQATRRRRRRLRRRPFSSFPCPCRHHHCFPDRWSSTPPPRPCGPACRGAPPSYEAPPCGYQTSGAEPAGTEAKGAEDTRRCCLSPAR